MNPSVTIDRKALAAFCRRHAIRRLAVFGSALLDGFGPHSNVGCAGVNLTTTSSSGAFRGELDIEGTAGGNYDSTVAPDDRRRRCRGILRG